MTVNELIEQLQQIVVDRPEVGEWDCVCWDSYYAQFETVCNVTKEDKNKQVTINI